MGESEAPPAAGGGEGVCQIDGSARKDDQSLTSALAQISARSRQELATTTSTTTTTIATTTTITASSAPPLSLISPASLCSSLSIQAPTALAGWTHRPPVVVEQGDDGDGDDRDEDLGPVDPCDPAEVPPSTPFVRRHRRRTTRISRADLNKFRTEVLGIPSHCDPLDEALLARPSRPASLVETFPVEALDQAFATCAMSLSNGGGMHNGSQGAGLFTSFMDNTTNTANMPRQTPSPSAQHGLGQVNGGGGIAGMNVGMPMNAGHQMDLNHLYEMVVELSDVLKNNREMTRSIIGSAEDIMRRAGTEGTSPTLQQVNGEISAARIAELERALAREKHLVDVLKREQSENAKLIGEYETAVGIMVEHIRNYCQNNNMHFLAQKRHYNNLLQAERDAHLVSRLDRDYWHAQTMKCAEMIRTAYSLRCEEEEVPVRVISGLQNEVRAYRNALGMDPEKPGEEYGWEFSKDLPHSVD